jgi:putative transposase
MPSNLVRYQKCGVFHFLTFSCYRRQPLLAVTPGYELFERQLEWTRLLYRFVIAGYVLMPEHAHLLVGEPVEGTLGAVIQVLKQITSHLLKAGAEDRSWQRRYYDFNVWSEEKVSEKLHYMHQNPVCRGLAERPEDWPWSSFRHYATGQQGTVEIESYWTAAARGHQLPEISHPAPPPPA